MLNAGSELERASQVPAPELECRISALIGLFKSRTEAATVAGMSTDQLARYEKGGTPSFPPLAKLAVVKGVRLDWLATGEGDMYVARPNRVEEPPGKWASDEPSQPLRRDDLKIALQLATEALGEKELPPGKHAELVTLIYELLVEGLPEAKVLRFARAFAA
ncbi:helix-turn-helix domain-containing protein [Rhodanobacter ginsengisoli]|jgi:Bacteriophage CI repressor helix-turn-helix domain.|uniref:Helix-turn-helix domain-containing protein n=1 Tax=Rhodanobacter ginsengisoli TaxID=418646 RepID=A0ABW0QJX3_9GAMM